MCDQQDVAPVKMCNECHALDRPFSHIEEGFLVCIAPCRIVKIVEDGAPYPYGLWIIMMSSLDHRRSLDFCQQRVKLDRFLYSSADEFRRLPCSLVWT